MSGKATPANFRSAVMGDKKRPTEYTLEWEVSSYTPVTEFRLEVRLDTEDAVADWRPIEAEVFPTGPDTYSGKVSLHKLARETSYLARVAAKNSYGMSTYSNNFQFSTFSERMIQDAAGVREPKHEKSVSGASSSGRVVLSPTLAILLPTLAILLLTWLQLR